MKCFFILLIIIMNTEEKFDEGLLSNWLFNRNKNTRKSLEDNFGIYKERKLEDLAELYTISKMIDSVQGGKLKIMCGDNIRYRLLSLKRDLGHAPSYEVNQIKHILRLIKTVGVISKFEELCQGEIYDKYTAAGRSLTNFLGAYIEYERNAGKHEEEKTPEKEETIEPKPIEDSEKTFKTFIAICSLLEKKGLTPKDLSIYFDRAKDFDQEKNKVTPTFKEVVDGFGYIPDDVFTFIAGALLGLYEEEFRETALSPAFFNYIKNSGHIENTLTVGSLEMQQYVIKFFIIEYASELPGKYKALWQTFLARTNGLTVLCNTVDDDGNSLSLLDKFDTLFSFATSDPQTPNEVKKQISNIRNFIQKYLETLW